MFLCALKYITLKVVKNMTVFMSLILILRRFTERGHLSILVKWTRISIKRTFMGLWNDFVIICIKIYNFKGSNKYDRFYVTDFNFEKVYRNGPSLHF